MSTTTEPSPAPIRRHDLHNLFGQFIERDDVKTALAQTIQHKKTKLLQTAFHNETGYDISANWVYKVMRNQTPTTAPVQIGDKTYNVIPPRNI
jgi:hypothetical protein